MTIILISIVIIIIILHISMYTCVCSDALTLFTRTSETQKTRNSNAGIRICSKKHSVHYAFVQDVGCRIIFFCTKNIMYQVSNANYSTDSDSSLESYHNHYHKCIMHLSSMKYEFAFTSLTFTSTEHLIYRQPCLHSTHIRYLVQHTYNILLFIMYTVQYKFIERKLAYVLIFTLYTAMQTSETQSTLAQHGNPVFLWKL